MRACQRRGMGRFHGIGLFERESEGFALHLRVSCSRWRALVRDGRGLRAGSRSRFVLMMRGKMDWLDNR